MSETTTVDLPIEGELASLDGATGWLNSQPLATADLRGKVVLIDFWTYTCINWLRTLSYVRAWGEKYEEQGLVVVGVHTPEFPFEHDVDNVRQAAQDMRVEYPIALDSDHAIWRAFNNRYWPAVYIADAQGRIRHHKFGEGGYREAETVIQLLLREAGRGDVGDGLVSVDAEGLGVQADWANLESSETYLGYEQAELRVAGRCRFRRASYLRRAGSAEPEPLGFVRELDDREGSERPERCRRGDRVPFPLPRRPSRHGGALARHVRPVPCARRWRTSR